MKISPSWSLLFYCNVNSAKSCRDAFLRLSNDSLRAQAEVPLLDQAEQDDVEILVEMLDTEGEVFNSFDFQHVKLAHKKRTTYTGNLFSGDAEMDFTTEITSADGFADSGGNVEF